MIEGTLKEEHVQSAKRSRVSIAWDEEGKGYPNTPPFNPSVPYPEYPFMTGYDPGNQVYDLVRDTLIALELDPENLGTRAWNPLGEVVAPGNTVLIKPNLVKHDHSTGKSIDSVIVHASVIRAVLDYVWIALRGGGKIVIADTPLEAADFAEACDLNGLTRMVEELSGMYGIPVQVLDLRSSRTHVAPSGRLSESPLPGDPLGYTLVDLGRDSELACLDGEGTNYHTLGDHSVNHFDPYTQDRGTPNTYHNTDTHTYRVGNTVLRADTVISIAKLKTHKKAGVTLNLKNMIGIINGKAFIPHHRPGPPPYGDSYPSPPPRRYVAKRNVKRWAAQLLAGNKWLYASVRGVVRRAAKALRISRKVYAEWGEWYGNDTIWRTILDINRVLFYADKFGVMRETKQRNYLCFIDGIVGMEGEGPMGGDPVPSGVVLAGDDPVAVDTIAAEVMGFDSGKVQTIKGAGALPKYALGISDLSRIDFLGTEDKHVDTRFRFKPSHAWIGHIERNLAP
jgi:uncharacterized protein (DUF362 family)